MTAVAVMLPGNTVSFAELGFETKNPRQIQLLSTHHVPLTTYIMASTDTVDSCIVCNEPNAQFCKKCKALVIVRKHARLVTGLLTNCSAQLSPALTL